VIGFSGFGAQAQLVQPGSDPPPQALQTQLQGPQAPAAGPGVTLPAPAASLPDAPSPESRLPEAALEQTSRPVTTASIGGLVMDPTGAVIPGALVTLQANGGHIQRTVVTDEYGSFSFSTLQPGTFTIHVKARGFGPWTSGSIALTSGQAYQVPDIALEVATTADIEVFSSQTQLAEEQMHMEEKQRVLGVIPNFYTSYVWNAAPLTTRQKFALAVRSEIDPMSFLGAAVGAGIEQWQRDYMGYGEGAKGFAKRFGASYVDGFDGAMIGSAILPSLLHQDPRYYWKGTGTTRQRALYSLSTVVICKGDNGKWETNYSNIIGNFAAGAVSNLYYPPANRGVQLTIDNALLGFAAEAVGNLFQEFLFRKISTGVQP
jgi:protocatechuate 3,4-dioxygenase beta subunit